MSSAVSEPTRDDVLDAFSVEPRQDRETLERYLVLYPQFAGDLVDLSRELSRTTVEHDGPLSAEEEELLEKALDAHRDVALGRIGNPFAGLDAPRLRRVARDLDVPRQVVAAFQERKVVLSSVPRRFLARLAAALDITVETLMGGLLGSAVPVGVRSYRADERPGSDGPVSFEQILIDAGIEGAQLDTLMAETD